MMNVIMNLLFVILEKAIPLFPLKFVQYTARLKGKFFFYVIPIRKKTALKNLQLAFPEKSRKDINRIIKGVYINVFLVIFEFFYFPKLTSDKIKELVHVTNPELINNKLQQGKGLVLISAHFGNWELIAYAVSRICGEPFNIIVKEQSNKVLDRKINRIRESGGNKMIYMEHSLKNILMLLGSNKIVAMLGDQSPPKESPVKTDFFIKNVPTFEGAARFAIKTGAPVIFGVPVRNKDYTYSITLIEIDTSEYKDYNDENIARLTQEHVNLLKEHIIAHPDHWLWFHRRFKNVE
jgi:KDO2-lipid IV(A) lauroyltransferase